MLGVGAPIMLTFNGNIQIIKKLASGSNCTVFLGSLNTNALDKIVVIKLFRNDNLNLDIYKLIADDIFEIRTKLQDKAINISKLYGIIPVNIKKEFENNQIFELPIHLEIINALIILESLAGTSLRDYFRRFPNLVDKQKIFEKVENFIFSLPEDIPIDTNPGNIVFDVNTNKLSLVDFFPPQPWKYRENAEIDALLKLLFPSLNILPDENEKIKRYYLNEFRLRRFYYYINKITPIDGVY